MDFHDCFSFIRFLYLLYMNINFPPIILLHLLHVEISTSEKINLKLGIVECT